MSRVYLSLGSNLGDSYFYLLNAINSINKLANTRISAVSKFYKTKPWGILDQNDFINCCVEIETNLLPFKLLSEINNIERTLDRTRTVHWGPRTIDIDIIFYDDLRIQSENLIIPHKYYSQRNFVLVPLLDIIWDKSLVLKYIDKLTKGELELYNYPKKIAISACLLGDNVKYSGGNNLNLLFCNKLKHNYIGVCPEVLGGLTTPRAPAEKIGSSVFTKDGTNVTKEFELGAKLTLDLIKNNNIDIIILQSRSPSCGLGKIYDGNFNKNLIDGNGITVDLLLKNSIKIINC